MPDRNGAALQVGNPVVYHHDEHTHATATVIEALDGNRYLIQLDPRDQPERERIGAQDDPFLVDGVRLELISI